MGALKYGTLSARCEEQSISPSTACTNEPTSVRIEAYQPAWSNFGGKPEYAALAENGIWRPRVALLKAAPASGTTAIHGERGEKLHSHIAKMSLFFDDDIRIPVSFSVKPPTFDTCHDAVSLSAELWNCLSTPQSDRICLSIAHQSSSCALLFQPMLAWAVPDESVCSLVVSL
jgi:hypothetical protein